MVNLGGLGLVVLLGVRPLVVGLVVVAEVLLVLEHLAAVLALEGVLVLVPLLGSLPVGDGVEDDNSLWSCDFQRRDLLGRNFFIADLASMSNSKTILPIVIF